MALEEAGYCPAVSTGRKVRPQDVAVHEFAFRVAVIMEVGVPRTPGKARYRRYWRRSKVACVNVTIGHCSPQLGSQQDPDELCRVSATGQRQERTWLTPRLEQELAQVGAPGISRDREGRALERRPPSVGPVVFVLFWGY